MKPQLCAPLGRILVPILALFGGLALPFRAQAAACAASDLATANPTAFVVTAPNLVSVLNAAAAPPSVVCTITVGNTGTPSPNNLAISPDGLKLLVENDAEASVTIVDLTTAATNTVSLPGVTAPMQANLAVSPDNKLVYVVSLPADLTAGALPSLNILDLTVAPPVFATSQFVGSTDTFNGGIGVSFVYDAATKTVPSAFITIDANTYIVSAAPPNSISATAQVGGTTAVTGGTVAVDPTGAFAVVVDAAGNNQVANIPTAAPTTATALSPTPQCSLGRTVAITPTSASVPSTAYYSCNSNNFVQVIDNSTNTVTATVNVPIGSTPNGLAIATDGSSAFIANGNGSLSTVAIPTNGSTVATTTSLGSASFGGIVIMPVKLTISPSTANVATGASTQFNSNLRFAFGNKALTWTVSCTAGGAACGTIDATGKYTAPPTIPNSTVTVTATHPDMPASTQKLLPVTATVTVTPSQLAFMPTAQTLTAGMCSAAITVQAQDSTSAAAMPGSLETVALTSSSAGGTFYSDSACTAAITGTTIAATSTNSPSFYYTDTKAASPTITATGSGAFTTMGPTNATQTETVSAGPATQLAFTTQPAGGTGGTVWTVQPVLTLEDASGNTVTGTAQNVTLAIQNNAGPGGVLSGTTTVAVNTSTGLATFSGLSINKAGTGYTLTATGSTVNTTAGVVVSSAFNITPGPAARLAFTAQPTNVTAAAAIAPPVQVSIQDNSGNPVTTATSPVTIAIGTNPGSGTLSGTVTVNAVAGVASFSTLSINKTGTGYTLAAASGALTAATSNTFNVTPGAPAALVFTAQPTSAVAGAAIAPAVQVSINDGSGNLVTTATNAVTVAIATNAGGGTLSGTLTVNAVAGVASFSNLSINKTGTGYTLAATSGTLTAATSTAFNITPGTPAKLAFTAQPSNVVAATPIAPPVQVSIQDINGNLVPTATNAVTIAIGTNPGGGTLSGTLMVNAVAGVASFSTLSINKSGTGYTLAANAAGLMAAVSNAFNVTAGTATQLAFTTQPPANGTAGSALTASVVAIEDANGNVVTTSAASVTMSSTPTNLGGTPTVTAVNGVATFSNLIFTTVGSYSLTASSSGLTSATSTNPVVIAPGPPNKLVFTTQPPATSALGGNTTPLSPVAVRVEDAFGNLENTSTATVVISSAPANVSGVTSVAATNGVATFAGLDFTIAGTYMLTASSAGLTSATSTAVTITSTITDTITSTFTTVAIEDVSDTFTGKATGDPNNPSLGLTWKMTSCGSSMTALAPCGTLASNGTYTPPNKVPVAPGNVFVAQATAVADPNKTMMTGNITIGSTITVAASIPTASQTLPVGFGTTAAAIVTNDPNNPTLGVTWSISNCTAGTAQLNIAQCGILNGAAYTAPATYPASAASTPVTVTFTATSVADPSKSQPTSLMLVADTLSLSAATPPNPNLTILSTASSAMVTLNLDGPNTTNIGAVTFSGLCSNFGKLSGTCSFSSVTPGVSGSPSTLTLTLSITRASTTLPMGSFPDGVNFPMGKIVSLLLLLPLLVFAFAAARWKGAVFPRLRLSASFLVLLFVCVLWASACNQFSQPALPSSPQPPTIAQSGMLTVTVTPSSAAFQPATVTVSYTVQ